MIFTDGYKLNIINNSTLLVDCHWVTITNINANNQWILYDSLNNTNNLNNLKPLFKKIKTAEKNTGRFQLDTFPDISTQTGSDDCGLFALAYAIEVCRGNNPANLVFKQDLMRNYFNNCLQSKKFSSFP